MVARGTRTARSSQSHGLHQLGPHARDQARAERVYVWGSVRAGAVRFWRYQVQFLGDFRHRSKRTFCGSRRDLAIRVVGTPAFQIGPKEPLSSRRSCALKLNPLAQIGKNNFLTVDIRRWCGRKRAGRKRAHKPEPRQGQGAGEGRGQPRLTHKNMF